jgi:hypothetical protein
MLNRNILLGSHLYAQQKHFIIFRKKFLKIQFSNQQFFFQMYITGLSTLSKVGGYFEKAGGERRAKRAEKCRPGVCGQNMRNGLSIRSIECAIS